MPGLSLNAPLNDPWYGGAAISELVPRAFHVAIGGHPYLIDVMKYSRRILPAVSDAQDTSTEPGEQTLSREGFWPRSQSRWDLGAGQDFFDEDGSSRRRFFTSKGVDIWTYDRAACLLNDTEKKSNSANTNLTVLVIGGWLYYADGATLRFTQDPTPGAPAFTAKAALGTITSIATDGIYIYVAAAGFNLQRILIGDTVGALTNFGALQPNLIAFANGRLLGATNNDLYEIDSAGAKPGGLNIRSDPRGTNAKWVSILGTPSSIFAAVNVGNTSEVYAITANDVSTALTAPVWASGLPNGETLNVMVYYSGLVLIGTSLGLRVASIISSALEYGEAIEVPGGVRCLEAQAEFCWFGWTNYDGTSTGLGRANLASNTSQTTIVPAYATDLMAAAQGTVTGVATFGTRRYFTVSGSGLWGETGNLVASGVLNSGSIRFGTLIDKLFTSLELGHDALPANASISASALFPDGTSIDLGLSSVTGTTKATLADAFARAASAQIELTLTRGGVTDGPCLRHWTIAALPIPKRVHEILVPLILKEKVEDLVGKDWSYNTLAEFAYLDGLRAENAPVIYQEGDRAELVRVDNVALTEGEADHWRDPKNVTGELSTWFQGTVIVRLLTKEES